jgi:tetratricopeptide (TPR) repeat protein
VKACFLICLLLVAAAADAADSWVEVQSEHFLVRSDAGEAATVALVGELERFRRVTGRVTNVAFEGRGPDILHVDAYARLRDYHRAHRMKGTLGFYDSSETGDVAAISLEPGKELWQPTGIAVLRHEYTHHLLHRYSPWRYPIWYDEGFAEYLSVMEFRGDQVVLGLPVLVRLAVLRNSHDWLDTRMLMESKARYIGRLGSGLLRDRDRHRVGIGHQYSQGWLITHFLQHSARFRSGIGPYIRALNEDGADEASSFRDAFGVSYREFDGLMRDYWHEGNLPYATMPLEDDAELTAPRIRQMQPLEGKAVAYETRARLDMLEGRQIRQAKQAFTRLLEANARPLEMRSLLASLAMDAGDWKTARIHVDALLSEAPRDAAGLTLWARLLRADTADENLSTETVLQMRASYLRALDANPAYVPALMGLAALSLLPQQTVDGEARNALDSVLALAPGLVEARALKVGVLAKDGELDEALASARVLVSWADSPAERRRFERLLQTLEKTEKAAR